MSCLVSTREGSPREVRRRAERASPRDRFDVNHFVPSTRASIHLFIRQRLLPTREPPPRNRASAVHSRVDQSVEESAAKATGLARPAGTRVVLGDLTAGWPRCRRGAGGPAGANEHGQLLASVAGTPPNAGLVVAVSLRRRWSAQVSHGSQQWQQKQSRLCRLKVSTGCCRRWLCSRSGGASFILLLLFVPGCRLRTCPTWSA